MRIAMFTNNYKPFIGGVPISIERLSNGLRELGHEVVIFAPDYGNCQEDGVVRYKTLYKKGESGIMVGNCFDRIIEKQFLEREFDVIHVHHPMIAGYAALHIGKKYGIPVAYTYHTRYEEYLHYFKWFSAMEHGRTGRCLNRYGREVLVPRYMTAFANACDLVFAPTKLMQDCLKDYGTDTRISVLPTGLEDGSFAEDKEAAKEIRKRYIGNKTYLFSTISRLAREKNLDFLLEGAARMKALMGDCFRIMIIGEGGELEHLREQAVRLGIEDNLTFVGKVPNELIKNYQFASDLFLFASKSETQGIVLLEAMAAGSPVVAVKASGVVEVVRSGYNGYMTGEDADEWAEAVQRAVGNREHYCFLKRSAAETAACYHSSKIAEIAEQQYVQMVNECRKQGKSDTNRQAGINLDFRRLFGVS